MRWRGEYNEFRVTSFGFRVVQKIRISNSKLETTVLRVLVTGGSGYLGTHVRRFFDAEDLSRRTHLDILSPLDAAQAGAYEVVIHLAAHVSKDPAEAETCFRTNVEGTVNLLRAMEPNTVFVFASTKDVYGAHADNFD